MATQTTINREKNIDNGSTKQHTTINLYILMIQAAAA
jgi:hypothetical protein